MQITIGFELDVFSGEKLFEIDSQKHTLITGKSGVGKSTMLVNNAIWHVRNGEGILFQDPHGDAADKLITRIPQSRIRDVIIIDPSASAVPPLNLFDFKTEKDKRRAADSFLSIIKNISGETGYGPEMEHILQVAVESVITHIARPTVIHVWHFLTRKAFRAKIAPPEFIQQYDGDLRPSERASRFSSSINKVHKFVRPVIRTMLGQEESIDFLKAMDSRKIIIVRLPEGELGATTASLIGSVIVSSVAIAALRRKGNCAPFHIFIDEVHAFVHGINLPTLLAEARKFGISLTLATQNLAQLPTPSAVFGNCSNIISFRMGGEDSEAMAREFGADTVPDEILNLPDRKFFAKVIRDRSPYLGRNLRCLPPIRLLGDEAPQRQLIRVARKRYCKDRRELDARVVAQLSS